MTENSNSMTKILVIDDEQYLLEEIVDILTFEGYTVISAENGRQGVEMSVEHHPDLIICDVMMPEMNGYEVLKELRNYHDTVKTPFVFLTAKASFDDLRIGMNLGADDYLTKPFQSSELMNAITTRLEKSQQQEAEYEAKLDMMRQMLVTTLPHELRTPLTSILGAAQIMNLVADDLTVEQILNYTQLILNAGNRLHRLVENYLLYSQLFVIEKGYSPEAIAKMKDISFPSTLIKDLITQLTSEGDRYDDVRFDMCDNISLSISPDHLRKGVLEVIDNAMKFSPTGTEIQVSTHYDDKKYVICIKDHGRGMTPSQIKEIAPFVQFERKQHEQQGSGLGLIIARKLIELHGGCVLIESQPDHGTHIQIELPVVVQ